MGKSESIDSYGYLQRFKYFQDIQSRVAELSEPKSNPELRQEYWDLKWDLGAGNCRHVVWMLYTEEGLSSREFGEKIGYTENEIDNFTKHGIITLDLLNAICNYFGIKVTSDFKKYLPPWERDLLHGQNREHKE